MLGIEISMDIHVGQVWESIKVRKHYVVKGRAGNKYILWGNRELMFGFFKEHFCRL